MENIRQIRGHVRRSLEQEAQVYLSAATYQLKELIRFAGMRLDPNGLNITDARTLAVRNLLKGAAFKDAANSLKKIRPKRNNP